MMKKIRIPIIVFTMILAAVCFSGCSGQKETASKEQGTSVSEEKGSTDIYNWKEMKPERSLELKYATQFAVDYYEGGYALISITEGGKYLVVPENMETPADLDSDIIVLKQPLDHIYLVATSAMDLFRAIDGIDNIRLSGTDADKWYIDEAREAMESGKMLYAGKYNTPDYEVILENECDLAVESTMIYHTPEVQEKLEEFGIPVLVERSSYESHPLGRTEWIKLYAVLLGKEKEAEEYFDRQMERLEEVIGAEKTGKTVAFFYISSNGYVNVRKTGDYVAKMIELAGGEYVFGDLGNDNSLSTMNMQMENFYAGAKDADYLIYNSTIDSELETIDDLLEKSHLLADFKAVKEGNVWCTKKNLFQETTGLADMILDMHKMMTEEDDSLTELTYMHKLTTNED